MNTPVSSKIKQLLYDKGFRYEVGRDEITCSRVKQSLAEQRWNEGDLSYVDITTAEVVMWLYENHGFWIANNYQSGRKTFLYELIDINSRENTILIQEKNYEDVGEIDFNSPTEAYEAAIEYTLNNLI